MKKNKKNTTLSEQFRIQISKTLEREKNYNQYYFDRKYTGIVSKETNKNV
jgi:hypothetical protein